jgi:hypothetical protein
MGRAPRAIAEVGLLFAALFCALPPVPSAEVDQLSLSPASGLALLLFAASRIIRWQERFYIALVETLLFSAFVWGLNQVANILVAA